MSEPLLIGELPSKKKGYQKGLAYSVAKNALKVKTLGRFRYFWKCFSNS